MDALHYGYLVLVFVAAMAGRAAYPRIEQLWLRGKKPMLMPEYANRVEETYGRYIGLLMETAEVEVQMADLTEGVPEKYEDKLLLAMNLANRTVPALHRQAERLGRYKPEFALKTLAACLDESPRNSHDRCPYGPGQVTVQQIIPPPPALPTLAPPPIVEAAPPTQMVPSSPVEAPITGIRARRPFMVVGEDGQLRPAMVKAGT